VSRHRDAISVINASVGASAPRDKKRMPPANAFPTSRETRTHLMPPLGRLSSSALFLFEFYLVSPFSSRIAVRRSRENFRRKNRNLSPNDTRQEREGGVREASPLPSSCETSSAKCPTKIGIPREYRIPEVRAGLSEEPEVLRVFVISFLFSAMRLAPPARYSISRSMLLFLRSFSISSLMSRRDTQIRGEFEEAGREMVSIPLALSFPEMHCKKKAYSKRV